LYSSSYASAFMVALHVGSRPYSVLEASTWLMPGAWTHGVNQVQVIHQILMSLLVWHGGYIADALRVGDWKSGLVMAGGMHLQVRPIYVNCEHQFWSFRPTDYRLQSKQ